MCLLKRQAKSGTKRQIYRDTFWAKSSVRERDFIVGGWKSVAVSDADGEWPSWPRGDVVHSDSGQQQQQHSEWRGLGRRGDDHSDIASTHVAAPPCRFIVYQYWCHSLKYRQFSTHCLSKHATFYRILCSTSPIQLYTCCLFHRFQVPPRNN